MVHHPGVGAVNARVINCSADGLLVELGPDAPAKGALVALAEATLCRLHGEMFRLKALVVHRGDRLAGLMFVGGGDEHAPRLALLESLERGSPSPLAALQ